METGDCTLIDREVLMVSYLAGTLPPDKAEAFEAHYFACDQCWRELERGLEIRAAMEPASLAGSMPVSAPAQVAPAARHLQWGWLAAAASVVLVASLWRFAGTPASSEETPGVAPAVVTTTTPSAPVATPAAPAVQTAPSATPDRSRGGDNTIFRAPATNGLRPVARRDASGEIRIEWSVVEKASRYVVTIFATNGSQLLQRETSSPSIVIGADAATAAAFSGHADERLFAQVDAMGAAGVPLSKSSRVTIPARREEPSR